MATYEGDERPKPGASAEFLPFGAARWSMKWRSRGGDGYEDPSVVISFYDARGELIEEDEY